MVLSDFPHDVQYLIMTSIAKHPVGYSIYERIKKDYPQYWNEIGEFDPYFESRNRLVNFFKKKYRNLRMKKMIWNIKRYAKKHPYKHAGKGLLAAIEGSYTQVPYTESNAADLVSIFKTYKPLTWKQRTRLKFRLWIQRVRFWL